MLNLKKYSKNIAQSMIIFGLENIIYLLVCDYTFVSEYCQRHSQIIRLIAEVGKREPLTERANTEMRARGLFSRGKALRKPILDITQVFRNAHPTIIPEFPAILRFQKPLHQ